jgi:phosphatidylglycerol:prolipoprotein diacylglycerol transferase
MSSPVHWGVSPELVQIGPLAIRWYGLLFASSFLAGFRLMIWVYNKEGLSAGLVDRLLIFVMVGTVVGARLGHCLFYEPGYYLSNPIEILKFWRGGLASHGAAIGILTAIYLYTRGDFKRSYLWVLDRSVIAIALSGFFIRLGNLFNSEILGKPTDLPWAFVFTRVDMIPRHPAQLYESLAYLGIFILLLLTYRRQQSKIRPGLLFGLFLSCVFGFRFLVEFVKENQSPFEAGLVLNMGQLLSIPLVLFGLFMLLRPVKSGASS